MWEDVKYGLNFGSHAFLDHIKDKYLSGNPDKELPQLNRLLKEEEPDILLSENAKILGCNIKFYKSSPRLAGEEMDKRDILMYILWKTGKFTNIQIGILFGLTFSSVSRRISHVKSTLPMNESMKDALKKVKTLIKVCSPLTFIKL